jgi:hypothetical protein
MVAYYNYNQYSNPLKGLGPNYAPAQQPVPALPRQTNIPSSIATQDRIVLHGLNLPSDNQTQFVNFDPVSEPDGIDGIINHLRNSFNETKARFNVLSGDDNVEKVLETLAKIPDEEKRNVLLRDYFVRLLDDGNYNGAIKTINATPALIYKNSMFKGLIQELASNGEYDNALKLVSHYPDERIKSEMSSLVADYINNYGNDSTKAAEALGDPSMLNIAKLKADSWMGSVGSFFSGIGHSLTNLFSNSSKASGLAYSAENTIGKTFRYDFLDGGNLACAYAVSQMLKGVPGLQNVGSSECNTLANQLAQNGFSRVYGTNYQPIRGPINYQAGDVVFFNRSGKSGYGHVGVVAEVRNGIPYMVHNSSGQRAVVKVRLDQYYKTPVAVFRANG